VQDKLIAVILAAGLPLFWIVSLWLSNTAPGWFVELTREDGPIENLEALILLAGCILSGVISWRLFRQNDKTWAVLYAVLTLALFFVAGEEISWGQRIFGVVTPEWLSQKNKQHELNVHNLKLFTNALQRLYDLLPIVLLVISIGSARLSRLNLVRWRADLWMPPAIFIPIWLCCASYRAMRIHHTIVAAGTRVPQVLQRLQEPMEFILYAGALTFLILVFRRTRAAA
jgi:hypothetical protein